MKKLMHVILALSLAIVISGSSLLPFAQAQEPAQMNLQKFDLLTADTGWILLNGRLFWTSEAGEAWEEITPSLPSNAEVQDVEFIDPSIGWVLWTTADTDAGASFHLAHTADRGKTWSTNSLSLFEAGDPGSYAEKAEMGWFDSQTGWIAVKQMSGSNFSLGTLFTTSDGGQSWSRFALPVADDIHFSDPQTGWATGGPAGNEIFQTQDGGATWKDMRPSDLSDDSQVVIYPPFDARGQGLLLATILGTENNLNIYSLESGEWALHDQIELNTSSGRISISILDAQTFVTTLPGTTSIVRMTNGAVDVIHNQDGRSASVVELDMISLSMGWAKSIDAACADGSDSCSTSIHLLQTADGGLTWQNVSLPIVPSDVNPSAEAGRNADEAPDAVPAAGNTEVLIGQGFDRCEIPTLSQMQTWWDASPYEAVNLYIGGSSRACANSALSSSYLSELYQQGWKFIPTWVGPQAPCTGYRSRMSSDVIVAFNQGVSEANLAVERLAALGLTDPDKTGSVVYYDIEHYGTDTACRAAVNAFMNGWVSQLHARGNVAGVYGSTLCNTGLSDFRNITHVPDVIWPARWYHNIGEGYYDPTANVWNLGSCIPNTVWANHQRIRQYEGDHQELWGGLALAIDSNAVDGVVAIPDTSPVNLSIGESIQESYKFVPHHIRHESYTGVNNGPIQITSPSDLPLIVSERVIYKVQGMNTSFTEMVALPNNQLDNTYWLPWYNNVGLDTQLRFANVSGSTATVRIYIGDMDVPLETFTLTPGESTRESFDGINDGPVRIQSNADIVAAERIIYKVSGVNTSFSEMMALPNRALDNIYWFPWYNHGRDLDTQLRFANVSPEVARVQVFIGHLDTPVATYTLQPGESRRENFAGFNTGPVKIQSNVDIIAAARVIHKVNGVNTSFSEIMALPNAQVDTTYWLPWYDNVDLDSQLRIANVSTQQATVRVYIGEREMFGSPFTLPAGASMRKSFTGIDDGPVRIVSTQDIVAAQRLIYKVNGVSTSFTEMMALPHTLLDTLYWLPWYNSSKDLDTQIRFGLP